MIVFRGILIGLCTLVVFSWVLGSTGELERARTAAFLTLVFTQLIHVFECKSEKKGLFSIPLGNNKGLLWAVLCSLLMIFGAIYLPFLQGIFKTVPLSLRELLLVGGVSLFGPIVSSWVFQGVKKSGFKGTIKVIRVGRLFGGR